MKKNTRLKKKRHKIISTDVGKKALYKVHLIITILFKLSNLNLVKILYQKFTASITFN